MTDKKIEAVNAVIKPNRKLWKIKLNIKENNIISQAKTRKLVSIAVLIYS